jgi:polyferredoxin
MGTEILYPIGIGLKWGLIVFALLSIIYVALLRSQRASQYRRIVLRIFALLLLIPSFMYLVAGPIWIFGAFFGDIQPFSDRVFMFAAALLIGGIIAVAWWALFRIESHLEKAL